MGKHPTGKRRARKQKVKARYSKAREEAQICGVIPTLPEGAVRRERVDPLSQEEQKFPALDRAIAAGKGWQVGEEIARQVIKRLAESFFEGPRKLVTREGVEIEVPPDRYLLKENAKVLLIADQRQWERDNPEEAGKARGKTEVNVGVTTVNLIDLYNASLREVEHDEIEAKIEGAEDGGTEDAERKQI